MPVKHVDMPLHSDRASILQCKEAIGQLARLFEQVEKCEAIEDEKEKGRQYLVLMNYMFASYDYWRTIFPAKN